MPGVARPETSDPLPPLEAMPPGEGATRDAVRDVGPVEEGTRLGVLASGAPPPKPPDGTDTPPPDPDDDEPPPEPPDDPPLEDPELAPPDDDPVPGRGIAWASARAGMANPTAIANVVSARIDLVMTLLPGPPGAHSTPWGFLQVYGHSPGEAISDFSVSYVPSGR